MYVPNYVPDPSEVPGNITEQPYPERLAFIRRVSIYHGITVAALFALLILPLPEWPVLSSGSLFFGLLFLLSMIRILWRGSRFEAQLSASFLPVLLLAFALLLKSLDDHQAAINSSGIAIGCALLYSLLCGRDFSFVGQFFLSLIVSLFLNSILLKFYGGAVGENARALCWSSAVLFYYVYDLASLMARRRKHEEWAAAVDLYRDLLNFGGYLLRVLRHWKKHKIWAQIKMP